jgi:hypothetical protein
MYKCGYDRGMFFCQKLYLINGTTFAFPVRACSTEVCYRNLALLALHFLSILPECAALIYF